MDSEEANDSFEEEKEEEEKQSTHLEPPTSTKSASKNLLKTFKGKPVVNT